VDVGVDVEAVDFKAAGVEVEEIGIEAEVEEVVEGGGAFDTDAEERYVGADADAGERRLMPDSGPGDAFALRICDCWIRGAGFGCGGERGRRAGFVAGF